jgi:hypothetical protein
MAGHHYHRDLAEIEDRMAVRLRDIDPEQSKVHAERARQSRGLSEKAWIWAHEDVGLTP